MDTILMIAGYVALIAAYETVRTLVVKAIEKKEDKELREEEDGR